MVDKKNSIKIYVADDHAIVRAGLRGVIEGISGLEVCGEAGNGRAALAWFTNESNPCDVLLLDLSMPGLDGLELLDELHYVRPELAVLVLTMQPEEQYALRVLRAGAAGYISKGSSADKIVAAIRAVAAGQMWISESVAAAMARVIEQRSPAARHQHLSNREFQVMVKLAGGELVKDIADELALSPKTVSTYRSRIMKKLGLKSQAELVRYAVSHKILQ